MTDTSIEARLTALEHKDEVRSTIAEYCRLTDALAGVDELIAMFDEDAALLNPSGTHHGRDAIDAYYRMTLGGETVFSRHHVMNQDIEIIAPNVARHRAYFIALLGRGGRSQIAMGQYDDELVRTDAGWKFTKKGNDIIGMTTLVEGWANGFKEER